MSFKKPNFSELNPTQKAVINTLNKTDRLAVIGGPGTGKTIIGLEAAVEMASSKKKCLFITYSTILNKFLDEVIKKENASDYIEVCTFHKWFYNALKRLGCDNPLTLQDKEYEYNEIPQRVK